MKDRQHRTYIRPMLIVSACLLVVIALCIVCGCVANNNITEKSTKNPNSSGTEVIIPINSIPPYTNNMLWGGAPEGIYEGLIIKGLGGSFEPALAESWNVSADAKIWTFHLVKNATWHDGTRFTCADVKYTNDYLTSNKLLMANVFRDVRSIDCPDNYTVVFNLKTSYSGFLDQLSRMPRITISPKHIWENISDPQHYNDQEFIGTGQFIFDQNTPGYIHYKRNDAYYGKKAQVSGVIFKLMTNPDSQVLALKTGQIDVVSDISPVVAASLKGEKNIAIYTINDSHSYELAFNMKQYPSNLLVFRKAMSHAVDRVKINSLFGTGRPTETTFLIPNLAGNFVNPSDVGMYDYNLTKTREILRSAGFTWNSAGDLLDPEGKPVVITVPLGTLAGEGPNQKIVSVLKEDWGKLGITLNTISYDDYIQYRQAEDANPVFIDCFGVNLHDDADSLMDFAVTPLQETNFYNYNNTEYNGLVASLRNTVNQQEIRQLAYKMQDILVQDIPTVPICTTDTIVAYRSDRFTGWDLGPGYYTVHDPRVLANITPVT